MFDDDDDVFRICFSGLVVVMAHTCGWWGRDFCWVFVE